MVAFPSDVLDVIKEITITSGHVTHVSYAVSGKRQSRSRNTQVWKFSLRTHEAMSRAVWQQLLGFYNRMKGRYTTFTLTLPSSLATPLGAGGGTPLVNGASQTGSSVTTDGWPGTTTVLKAGDFVQFDGSTKVYGVTQDVTSDSGGNATITIDPQLLSSPANNAAITITSIPFTVAFSDDTLELPIDALFLSSVEIKLEEVF